MCSLRTNLCGPNHVGDDWRRQWRCGDAAATCNRNASCNRGVHDHGNARAQAILPHSLLTQFPADSGWRVMSSEQAVLPSPYSVRMSYVHRWSPLTHSWRGARACLHFIHFSGLSRKMAERAWQGGRKEGDLYRRGGWAASATAPSAALIAFDTVVAAIVAGDATCVRELERVIIPRWRPGRNNECTPR